MDRSKRLCTLQGSQKYPWTLPAGLREDQYSFYVIKGLEGFLYNVFGDIRYGDSTLLASRVCGWMTTMSPIYGVHDSGGFRLILALFANFSGKVTS
jgi:hypothetical protein